MSSTRVPTATAREPGGIHTLMLNLPDRGRIGGIEAKVDGVGGIAELHKTIGQAQTMMGGDKKDTALPWSTGYWPSVKHSCCKPPLAVDTFKVSVLKASGKSVKALGAAAKAGGPMELDA